MVQELSHLIVRLVNYLTPCTSLTYHSSQQSLTGILTSFKLLFACMRTDGGWSASYNRMKGLRNSLRYETLRRIGKKVEFGPSFLTSRSRSNKMYFYYFNDHGMTWIAKVTLRSRGRKKRIWSREQLFPSSLPLSVTKITLFFLCQIIIAPGRFAVYFSCIALYVPMILFGRQSNVC